MKSEENVEKIMTNMHSSYDTIEFKCTNCKFKCMWKGKLSCKNTARDEPDEIENEDMICSDYEQL